MGIEGRKFATAENWSTQPLPATLSNWLVASPEPHARVQLYCLPPAGSGASKFHAWPGRLAPETGVFRIQPPGREGRFREPFCRSMRDYVEQVARCIEADQKPFSLFGHSMGAVAAFEAANLVRERSGREPVHLIVSAFPGPQLPPAPSLHELPDAELVREVRARYGGIPDEVLENPEILELLLPVLRADLALLSTYRYVCTAPLSCPITAIGGSSDRTVGETELRAWQDVTEARFSWHMLPGGHFVIDSALDEIISIVKQALRE